MRRARLFAAIAFGIFVFGAISLLVARGLSATGDERQRVVELLRAQAGGKNADVLKLLPDCRSNEHCVEMSARRTERLKNSGEVQILNFEPSTKLALTRQVGLARVAWRTGTRLPIVQCVRVAREGPLTGGAVQLISISDPIEREGSCSQH